MNFPVGIIDMDGSINSIVIDEQLLIELNEKLRKEGIIPIATKDSNGKLKTYYVQGIISMAKGCKGNVMFIPNDVEGSIVTMKS